MNVDALLAVLELTRTSPPVFCRHDLGSPFGLLFPSAERVAFHVLLEGKALFRLDAELEPIAMDAGDILLLPKGTIHRVMSGPDVDCVPFYQFLEDPGPQPETIEACLISGAYCFEQNGIHPLFRTLPKVIRIRSQDSVHSQPIQALIALLDAERTSGEPSSELLRGRLMDSLFGYIVRAWSESKEPGKEAGDGWIGAVKDPRIARSLSLIHTKTEEDLSVSTLADAARMSRAAFVRRFTQLVGESPSAYLLRCKMDLAGSLLRQVDASMGSVAERVGYSSEAAFQKAFKRVRGLTPATYRASFRSFATRENDTSRG